MRSDAHDDEVPEAMAGVGPALASPGRVALDPTRAMERYEAVRERLAIEHGNRWVKQRPRTYWRTSLLHLSFSIAGGLSTARIALVVLVHAVLLLGFVWLARAADQAPVGRRRLLQNCLTLLGAHTTIVVITGGLSSPFLPTLFGTALICTNAFGRATETRVVLAGYFAILVALVFLPVSVTGGPWPELWYRLALVTTLAYSAWIAAEKNAETTQVFMRAGAEVVNARDELLAARAARVNDLEAMAARVAHDLKNPLTAIAGLTQLLARSATDDKTSERLSVMNEECTRMESTLRDYLAFSRPLESLAPREQALGPVLDRVLLLFEARAAAAEIELVRAAGEVTARVDAARLEEALLNLVANAIEASPRGSTITLSVEGDGELARVEVRDQGSGMSSAVLARVGTPYFTTRAQGNGLGVALSRTVVRQHGGDLVYESGEGRGTIARITLPILGPSSVAEPLVARPLALP